jgi:hypothetical protein
VSGDTLYELGAELERAFAEIDAELESNGGELTEAMRERLDAAQVPWEEKVGRVALYYKGLMAEALVVKGEEDRLEARRKAKEKRAEWLRAYLGRELAAQSRSRVDTPLVTVRFQAGNPAASATTDLEFLDPRWVRSKTELSLDKEAVIAAWKAKEALPEGLVVTRGTSVRIV